jgi:hypothetical protein
MVLLQHLQPWWDVGVIGKIAGRFVLNTHNAAVRHVEVKKAAKSSADVMLNRRIE